MKKKKYESCILFSTRYEMIPSKGRNCEYELLSKQNLRQMNILKSLIRAIISLNQVNTFFYLYFFNIKYQLEMVNFNLISIAMLHNKKSINFCLIFKPIYAFLNISKKSE